MDTRNHPARRYTARCGAGNGHPAVLTLDATTDAEAMAEIDAIVADGYRNEQWASVELADGRSYIANNLHGQAVGRLAD